MASLHETLSSDDEILNKEDDGDEELDTDFDFGGMMVRPQKVIRI